MLVSVRLFVSTVHLQEHSKTTFSFHFDAVLEAWPLLQHLLEHLLLINMIIMGVIINMSEIRLNNFTVCFLGINILIVKNNNKKKGYYLGFISFSAMNRDMSKTF